MATMTPRELADELHLSVHTIVMYLKAGKIPGFQVVPGGPWRIDVDTYRAWVTKKSMPLDPNRIAPRSARSQAILDAAERRRRRR